MKTECELCGETSARIDSHHIDYIKDETIDVCKGCHSEIHNTQEHPELKPPDGQIDDFYGFSGVVDKSRIPSRPGWTIQIKTVLCGNEKCDNCPHGPYYYYYKREGEKIYCEYGGEVTDGMMAEQKRLVEY